MDIDAFSRPERERLAELRAALAAVGQELSLAQLLTLLTVALEPGLSVNELAERIEAPQQSASRYAAVLLGRYQSPLEETARDPLLAQHVNPTDPRRRALSLTDKGRDVVSQMINAKPVQTPGR